MFTLDRMEIQGFKSFYGRTQLEFRHGITAVVGPNGCGKSNISDAISWVLGDQSPRSLRADRMEDVIFNGSEGRKPMGMAEVSLRFLGTNGGPEPSEQLIVTRRLYRDGESEYSMNGSRCRLHDIQEVLIRSQVGSRFYSVIEQGKVDLILSAKPKDRRTLFEEAAGILGYKSKRRVALGKLEATQANLLRIHDILSEVAKQTSSLRRQVAKARRYRRLMDRIRDRRGILLRARLLELDRAREASDETRRGESELEAGLSAALARCEAEVEALRRRYEEAEGEARATRQRVNDLDREIDRDRLLRERSGQQAVETRRSGEGWTVEASEIRRRLTARTDHLAERSEDLARVRRELEALETSLQEREAEQRVRMQGAEESEEAVEDCRSQLLSALDGLSEARSRWQRLEEDLRRVGGRRREIEAEIGAAREERDRRQVEGEEATLLVASRELERERARREHEASETSLSAEETALEQLSREREILTGTLAQIEERLRALDEADEGRPGNGQGAEAILSEAREGRLRARGRVADLLRVDSEWVPAAEAALGELLGAVVVEHPSEAFAGIRYLKETGRGRCGFLATTEAVSPTRQAPPDLLADSRCRGALLDRLRVDSQGEAVLPGSLANTLIVSDLPAALDLRRRHPDWNYVTSEGDLLTSSGLLQGGAAAPGGAGPLSRRREREVQEKRLREAQLERDRLEAERGRREDSRRKLLEHMGSLQDRIQERERVLVEARFRSARLEEEGARAGRTLQIAEAERSRLAAEEEALSAEKTGLKGALSTAEVRRRDLEEAIAGASARLASQRERSAAGAESLGAFRSQVAVERQKIASREEEIAVLQQSVREEQGRLERAESEACAAATQAADLESAAVRLSAGLDRRQAERGEASVRLEAGEVTVASLKTDLLEAEQAEKEARRRREELRRRISESEVAAARLGVELQHLESSCREDLAIGLKELRTLPPPPAEIPLAELEKEMADLRDRLERFGPVNLVAMEQYAEMEERQSFLSKQKKDLEDSIESLNDTIRKINRTSREKFLEAFAHIQEEFDRCFTILFEGGKAELRLMEGEDVLECGIEITASPPGKRLQNISLLSGGEKAMTAVALLFAIFRYRPSSFCVLDEVDAALDEANVTRFTRMLKEMAPGTQFILITHNRRSMEAAGLLYGITMEEPGVSKVVSVQLEN